MQKATEKLHLGFNASVTPSSPSFPQSAKADASHGAGSTADNKLRATSEPPELAPHSPKKAMALKNSLVKRPSLRLGSAKRPGSATTPSPLPPPTTAATTSKTSEEVGHVMCHMIPCGQIKLLNSVCVNLIPTCTAGGGDRVHCDGVHSSGRRG